MSRPHPWPFRFVDRGRFAAGRRGFAILISITLLSFLVLLLLSLALLTRVGTQATANALMEAEARQNALVAVQAALGQLQRFAGPDQRITLPAEFADGNAAANGGTPVTVSNANIAGLPATLQSGTRFWTAVLGNPNPAGAIFTRSPGVPGDTAKTGNTAPKVLTWLVSGNEGTSYTTTTYGQVQTATGITFTPSQAVNGLVATSTFGSNLTIAGVPAVLLVGGNSATSSTGLSAAVDNYLAAPLVSLSVSNQLLPGFSGNAGRLSGRYAYAVLDEGVKAKVNVRDPYDGSNTVSGTSTLNIHARVRVESAQRTGIELVTGFADSTQPSAGRIGYPVNTGNTFTNSQIERILTLPQVRFLDNTATTSLADTTVKENFHNLTAFSFGVLADSQRGGLRKDLTAMLEDNALFSAQLKGRNILPDTGAGAVNPGAEAQLNLSEPSMNDPALSTITPDPRNVSPKNNNGPTWDELASFYNLASTVTDAVTIRSGYAAAATAKVWPDSALVTQIPIAPVIAQSRLFWQIILKPVSGSASNHLFIRTYLLIALGNPYSVTLSAPQGVQFVYRSPKWGWPIYNAGEAVGLTGVTGLTFPRATSTYPILNAGYNNATFQTPYTNLGSFAPFFAQSLNPDPDTDPSAMGGVTFQTPAFTIPPGEITAFTVDGQGTQGNSVTNSQTTITLAVSPSPSNYYDHDTGILQSQIRTNVVPMLVAAPPVADGPSAHPDGPRDGDHGGGGGIKLSDGNCLALYMKDPSTGRVLGMVGNDDLPHSPLGTNTATATTSAQGLEGFFNILNLPGMPSAPDAGQDNQMGLNERLYADHNLTATYKVLPWSSTPTGGEDFIPTMASYYVSTGNFATQYGSALPPTWGRDFTSGNNLPTVMRDLPRRSGPTEMPIISLGYLQHASLGADDFYPFPVTQVGQPIGNSWFNPYVTRTASVQPRNNYCYGGSGGTGLVLPVAPPGTAGQTTYYDLAYLLNAALWDRYYFSSIPQVPQGGGQPANPRLKFVAGPVPTPAQLGVGPGVTPTPDPAGLALPKEFAAARYLMVDGAFNVNSTSVEAWKAVLGSLRKRSATINDPAGATTASSSFPRSLYQTGSYSAADTGTDPNSYAGFRKLSDAQIASLASCLVQEIRLRGPFMSLAHFINRNGVTGNISGNLSASTANTVQVEGALQMAIDRALLNTRNFAGNDSDAATAVVNDQSGTNPYADTMPAVTITASTSTSPPPGTGVTLNKSTGIPGWLTQADVLEVLGPVLAARSDTFVIRAYGDALDPVNTDPANVTSVNILGRAWCEAVVQRFPDYDDASNAASVDPNGATGAGATITPANQTLGRKFRVVAFRWLTPNDL